MKTTVDLYFWINCFFTFSLIGYILECIVLTVENRKPVYNRGFGHGPFCIIYGFGAVGAAVLLRPVSDDMVKLYFASMLMATTMELITAKIMIRSEHSGGITVKRGVIIKGSSALRAAWDGGF